MDEPQTEQGLKQKTAKGLMWGGMSNGAQQLLNLIFGIFLSRLLTPSDYGMVGMLTIFSLIAYAIQEGGFSVALVNKKDATHKDYNAVFWFSLSIGALLYVILFFCAPLIAKFFHQPQLIPLSRFMFLSLIFSSLGIVPAAYLYRNLLVRERAYTSILSLVISGIIGILMAANGFSYWGIATQYLMYTLFTTIGYWAFSHWKPSLKIDFSPIKGLFSFSFKVLITNIFQHINNQVFSIFLGKYYSETEVGYYNQANKWNGMGTNFIWGMIHNVTQPVFARVEHNDVERNRQVLRKMLRFTAFISFPMMFGLSLVSQELITIAITDKWLVSADVLQILCIWGAFLPIQVLYGDFLVARGRSNVYMWNIIAIGLLQLTLLYFLFPYGIFTMIYASVAFQISWLVIWQYFIWREIRFSLWSAIKDISPYLFLSAGIMIVTSLLSNYITDNLYFLFAIKITIAASLYTLIMYLSKSVIFKETVDFALKSLKLKKRGR